MGKFFYSSLFSYFINTSYVVNRTNDPFDQPFLSLREIPSAIYVSSSGKYEIDFDLIYKDLLFPSIFFFVIFFFTSIILKTETLRLFTKSFFRGIRSKGRFVRFVQQLRLAIFYLASTAVGYYLVSGQPWFRFPLNRTGVVNLYYPSKPESNLKLLLYYQYELGFYMAELLCLFIEPRRSDFYEFVLHHILTIVLIVYSYSISEFRTGAYILFLHDFTDFFLCAAKVFYYIGLPEYITNCSFGGFVSTFIYFRLYCLPLFSYQTLTLVPGIRSSISYSFWCVFLSLAVVLQCLHFFWFYLIVRVIVRLCLGIKGDVRSDEDIDENEFSYKNNFNNNDNNAIEVFNKDNKFLDSNSKNEAYKKKK